MLYAILWFTAAFLFAIIGAILLNGWRKVPIIYMGARTRFGKRVTHSLFRENFVSEGWHFFFLYPFWDSYIPIKMEMRNFTVVSEKTRTPDGAETRTPIGISYVPLETELSTFLDRGQDPDVQKVLDGLIVERVREWADGMGEGPATWEELNRSRSEAASVLIRTVIGKNLADIPGFAQDVPTWIWLRFSSRPKPAFETLMTNEKPWAADDWKKVRDVLEKIFNEHGEAGLDLLNKRVEERREQIEALQAGTAKVPMKHLGIMLTRFNMEDMNVLGDVAVKAAAVAGEDQEKKKELKEQAHVSALIKAHMEAHPESTYKDAVDVVQTERGKATRAVDDKRISIDAATAKTISDLFGKGKDA